jgi:hypothetical protein
MQDPAATVTGFAKTYKQGAADIALIQPARIL